MSFFNSSFERSPYFAAKPWDYLFFENMPLSPPAELEKSVVKNVGESWSTAQAVSAGGESGESAEKGARGSWSSV